MDSSQHVRTAVGALTAANIAFQHGHFDHGYAQLDTAEDEIAKLRRAAGEAQAEAVSANE